MKNYIRHNYKIKAKTILFVDFQPKQNFASDF